MIKKLERHIKEEDGVKISCPPDNVHIIHKINELVDAVNELQNRIDPPSVYQVMKDKDAIIGKHIGEKQRLQDELDRTRKALDVAVDALKVYANPENWDCEHFYSLDARDIAGDVLEQITAILENKNGNC